MNRQCDNGCEGAEFRTKIQTICNKCYFANINLKARDKYRAYKCIELKPTFVALIKKYNISDDDADMLSNDVCLEIVKMNTRKRT